VSPALAFVIAWVIERQGESGGPHVQAQAALSWP
jgi:hypothetical protein